jgi:hypothetical protein
MRALAIGLLVLSLVGGYWLGTDRQTQQRNAAVTRANQSDLEEIRQLKLQAADLARRSAPQRAAMADAQAKADAAAKAAADQAKAADEAARRAQAASRSQNRTAPPTPPTPIPSSCSAYSGNRAIGCALMLQWGYGLSEMPCLDKMWAKESGWNEKSRNAGSGAYGIPQALPASKLAVYGSDYLTNPTPQIKWGLDYIKNRYGSPCKAWSYWQAHGWY